MAVSIALILWVSVGPSDHRLFIKFENDDFIALIVYIDDIVLTGNSVVKIDRIKHILDSNFHIKDLSVLKYFLGLEVSHFEKGISSC